MNFNKLEEIVVQEAHDTAAVEVVELSQLQLAVVAGGVGEVIFG